MKAEYQEFNGDWYKSCSKCKGSFGAEDKVGLGKFFTKDRSRNDGFHTRCRSCKRKEDSIRDRKPSRGSIWRRANHPEKYRARVILNVAVLSGKIKKYPCVKCGDTKSQGHHEDYKKPLEVIWLCGVCHVKIHSCQPAHEKEREV
jgi:ribosomal protein S27AE